jgi:hypothetical protein
VGDGIMPVRKIFEALIATKYQGFVDLEYEIHPDDPMPGVIASFAYASDAAVLVYMNIGTMGWTKNTRAISEKARGIELFQV